MTPLRLALAASALFVLCQCETAIGPVDSKYPTVDGQDALDVQWGLQPRKSKGQPRVVIPAGMGVTTTESAAAPVSAAAATAPAASPSVDPAKLQGLQ